MNRLRIKTKLDTDQQIITYLFQFHAIIEIKVLTLLGK